MKKIIRLTESDLVKLVNKVVNESKTVFNYFKIIDEDGDTVGVGATEKGSRNEVYFIEGIFELGLKPVKISEEEYNSYEDGDEIRNF